MADEIHAEGMGRGMGGSKLHLVVLIVVVVLVVLGFSFRDKFIGKSSKSYQAVFLTNGQVYFGKLSSADEEYATLKDIYYLQVTTAPGLQGSQPSATQAQQSQQLSLVKLGQELHGPMDSMRINRSQILFYEDMKDEGKVMQAIRQYQQNPPAVNSQSTTPPATNNAPAK